MTRLRRSRAVYRVYSEEEYLAGADALAAWKRRAAAGEPAHGRRLQRLAGAAALTGAVGTVGGVVGLAGLRTHAVDRREIARRVAPPTRAAAFRRHVSAPAPAHVARRRIPHPVPVAAHARAPRACDTAAGLARTGVAGRDGRTSDRHERVHRRMPRNTRLPKPMQAARRAERVRVRALMDRVPTVTVAPRPLWRIRLARELPRMLLSGVSCAGLRGERPLCDRAPAAGERRPRPVRGAHARPRGRGLRAAVRAPLPDLGSGRPRSA